MRRRTSREVALSRVLPRPTVKDQGGSFPPLMPDVPGMTLAAFWVPLGAKKKRPAVALRLPSPRLLDPVKVQGSNQFGNESAKRPGASDSSTPAAVPSGAAGQFSPEQDEKGSLGLPVGSRAQSTQTV
jgi:hypothetical protein